MLVITQWRIWICCESSQNLRSLQLFHNIFRVIIFHPLHETINMVFSGFLVSIPRWGASQNRFSWWAGCTVFRPPAAEIYKWKWQGIASISPSEKGSLEGTAGSVHLTWVKSKRLIIPLNRRNRRRWCYAQFTWSCSASMSGTTTLCYWISPWSQWCLVWNCGCCWPNTNIWSAFIDRWGRRDQDMV